MAGLSPAVLVSHQQQAAHDCQVFEQLNPLHFVRHIAMEEQGGGHQEQQPPGRCGSAARAGGAAGSWGVGCAGDSMWSVASAVALLTEGGAKC